jgi:hypothetical protein
MIRICLCRSEGDRGLGAVVDRARHISHVIWFRVGNQHLSEAILADIE